MSDWENFASHPPTNTATGVGVQGNVFAVQNTHQSAAPITSSAFSGFDPFTQSGMPPAPSVGFSSDPFGASTSSAASLPTQIFTTGQASVHPAQPGIHNTAPAGIAACPRSDSWLFHLGIIYEIDGLGFVCRAAS